MDLLDAAAAARLRAAPLTHPAGATLERPPAGFHSFSRARRLRRRDLDGAAADLLGWRMHERAGVRVAASAPLAAVDEVVVVRIGPGPLALTAPCRVLEVIDEPERRGFVYGTLPGHPVSGQEAFVVERDADGALTFTVRAFSRPAIRLTRLAGPIGRAAQGLAARSYLAALDRVADAR